jgi:tRNA (guanosine-2'-O-)-methyltransferase
VRRSTPNCSFVVLEQRKLAARLEGLDFVAVARALEPFVTDERRERFRAVFGARLDAVTVVMDAPHDPHNGAAVLRSCDAFGVQRLHVVERVEGFLAANAVARGSERWVDVVPHPSSRAALTALAASGHALVGTHPGGDLEPDDLAAMPRVALVLGNERYGIDDEIAAACSHTVRIPMRGFAESLNVSVTAAILLERATFGRPGDLSEAERDLLYARALVLSVGHAPEILAERRPELLAPKV